MYIMQYLQTEPTRTNLPNQTYKTNPTKPNLPNVPNPNLPTQTYQTKPTKPNLPNKPTKQNLTNQIKPIKTKSLVKAVNAWVRSVFCNVYIFINHASKTFVT